MVTRNKATLAFWSLGLAFSCGGPQAANHDAENPVLARCAANYARSKFAPSADVASKLDGSLNTSLQQWFTEMGVADCSKDDARKAQLRAKSITVLVTHGGELAALTAAGLQAGFDSDGMVSGRIEFRHVLDLASVPEVTFLEAQPVPTPDVE